MSETPSRKHYPERTVGFLMMAVSRDQFVSLLSKHGLDLPKFWRAAVDEPQVEEEVHSPKGGEAYRKGAPRPVQALASEAESQLASRRSQKL